ncbi:hypothetical protein [Streptomyces nanshensis]|uniref:hypothetical protein n=1 Tax=Streptomyces nanshensis TaxID=518642 RepID=UPI00114CFD52|nr:hypothetical protein [Streptomyces nanshensis]
MTVTDGPVLPEPNSCDGLRFRLEHLRITYKLADDGRWVVGPLDVDARGTTESVHPTTILITRERGGCLYGWEGNREWAFLHWIIASLRPDGRAELPFDPTPVEEM